MKEARKRFRSCTKDIPLPKKVSELAPTNSFFSYFYKNFRYIYATKPHSFRISVIILLLFI